ncbi:hypothetical protein [Cohnella lupini]|uniref:Uncharacterized protein n=1 Tax=Cohnella lupini TaxID=1294267 RepID=A0A3D9I6B1_9BACL|nr:hypothetical protein [Cohnella lupini]RED57185.1 hypothetical protein DFP95_11199 [Cohnella lupini]
MPIENEVKDSDRLAEWRKRNEEEIAQINEKSAINFYGISGMIIAILGAILGFTMDMSYLVIAVPLGIITMGIGEILRHLHKISNK